MTREEKIAKLSQIRVLVTNPVMTYDMGVQFDVITDKGALTDVGNIGQWPFLRSGVSEKLRTIQQKLIHNEVVSDEEFDDDDGDKVLMGNSITSTSSIFLAAFIIFKIFQFFSTHFL